MIAEHVAELVQDDVLLVRERGVLASTDGRTWTPVAFTSGGFNSIRSLCLDYRTVAVPGVPATQLRFIVDDPSGAAILNEVELFAVPP